MVILLPFPFPLGACFIMSNIHIPIIDACMYVRIIPQQYYMLSALCVIWSPPASSFNEDGDNINYDGVRARLSPNASHSQCPLPRQSALPNVRIGVRFTQYPNFRYTVGKAYLLFNGHHDRGPTVRKGLQSPCTPQCLPALGDTGHAQSSDQGRWYIMEDFLPQTDYVGCLKIGAGSVL